MQYASEKKNTIQLLAWPVAQRMFNHLNSALVSVEHTCTNAHTT